MTFVGPRFGAWYFPAVGAVDLLAFIVGRDGLRWGCLVLAVTFLVMTGWRWRGLAEGRGRSSHSVVVRRPDDRCLEFRCSCGRFEGWASSWDGVLREVADHSGNAPITVAS